MSLILIADDHPIAREPLARLLRLEGYETACAANGLEALDRVAERRPDLILLDMMMRKMNGRAFLRARADPRPAARGLPPVIVMTSVSDSPDVERARALGVRDVILKARFTVDDLLARVRTQLQAA